MTLEETYLKLGGNYEKVIKLLKSPILVKKIALKFIDDKSFELLEKSLEKKNCEEAFRAAHTLKGICLNLCFDRLCLTSTEITEYLRQGKIDDTTENTFKRLKEDYQVTISALKEFSEGL